MECLLLVYKNHEDEVCSYYGEVFFLKVSIHCPLHWEFNCEFQEKRKRKYLYPVFNVAVDRVQTS